MILCTNLFYFNFFLWSAENKYSGTVVHFGPVVMIKLTEIAEQERLDEQQSRA